MSQRQILLQKFSRIYKKICCCNLSAKVFQLDLLCFSQLEPDMQSGPSSSKTD